MNSQLIVAQSTPTFLPNVTALTGGTDNCLDALATAGLQIPHLFQISIGDALEEYLLRAMTDSDVVDGISIIQPTDADPAVNNVVLAFQRKLARGFSVGFA